MSKAPENRRYLDACGIARPRLMVGNHDRTAAVDRATPADSTAGDSTFLRTGLV